MTKILFVCHGNICRSPMAEFVLKEMARRCGLESELEIASAATSFEEQGNPVYPPARQMLSRHGIDCAGKTARRITKGDYDSFDLIIGMDGANMKNMLRFFGGDSVGKLRLLLDYAGRAGESVADPWYTGDFESTWQDVYQGCLGIMNSLFPEVTLDFSRCQSRNELYAVMRSAMLWQDFYGGNLDALHDILTGLPYRGKFFTLILPSPEAACRSYAERIFAEFTEASLPVEITERAADAQ